MIFLLKIFIVFSLPLKNINSWLCHHVCCMHSNKGSICIFYYFDSEKLKECFCTNAHVCVIALFFYMNLEIEI